MRELTTEEVASLQRKVERGKSEERGGRRGRQEGEFDHDHDQDGACGAN